MKKVKIKIVGKKENGICEAQIPIFKEVFAVTTWMDLEGITITEISQTEKDKYCIISLRCGT